MFRSLGCEESSYTDDGNSRPPTQSLGWEDAPFVALSAFVYRASGHFHPDST